MAIRLVQGRITASIAANFTRSCPGKCAKVRITQLLAGRRGGGRDSGAGGRVDVRVHSTQFSAAFKFGTRATNFLQ